VKRREWIGAAFAAVLLAGCAAVREGPTHEAAKQALAPGGKLRVAFLMAVIYGAKDPATGEVRGVAVDLGRELARRLGVPFEPVPYATFPALLAGARAGEFDVGLAGINPERAAAIDFSVPYAEVEQGYLVRAGAPIANAGEVDQKGIRVGVLDKAFADVHLSTTLKNATLVRATTINDLYGLIGAGKADAIATGKTGLFNVAAKEAGSRVLEGRILVEPIAMGVPKGRPAAGLAYLDEFVEDAKAKGLVKSAIDGAGLRGVVVAPARQR
jgi:polar amino acid transport system substrate-binding protein